MAGWLPTTPAGSWGLLPGLAARPDPKGAPSRASVAHAGHPGLGHQLALITPNVLLAFMDLQLLLQLQRLIGLRGSGLQQAWPPGGPG